MITKKFNYSTLEQITRDDGIRHYVLPTGNKVPSVTTIIGATEDKSFLDDWRARIGDDAADEQVRIAVTIGSHMHNTIENWANDLPPISGNNFLRTQAKKLATNIIDQYLKPNISEIYGAEIHLHHELYAGTCDMVAMYNGELCIIDFKNSKKPKSHDHLKGYRMQLAAYAMAHNLLYGTNISTGVNLIACREGAMFGHVQEVVVTGKDMEQAQYDWCEALEKYYAKSFCSSD